MKIDKFITLILITCYSCNQKPANTESQTAPDSNNTSVYKNDSSFKYVESFKGTLRCADCPGIITEITFINDNLSYHEQDSYIDRKVVNELSGSYTTDRGYKSDDDATVYVLDDDKPGHERRFLKLNDNILLILDANGDVIDSTSLSELFRVKK